MIDMVDLADEIAMRQETYLVQPQVDRVRDFKHLSRVKELSGLGLDLIDEVNVRFSGHILQALAPQAAGTLLVGLKRTSSIVIVDADPELTYYGMRIPGTDLIAGGMMLKSENPSEALDERVLKSRCSRIDWDAWCRQNRGIRPFFLRKLLTATHQSLTLDLMQDELLTNNESLADQLSHAYETITLLGDIPRQLNPNDPPFVLANSVIQRVQQICDADWSAYSLHYRKTNWWQTHGAWGMDCDQIESLILELLPQSHPQILVRNQSSCPLLRRKYPKIRSLVSVPLEIPGEKTSWLILANPLKRVEMGTEEAYLLRSIGQLLLAMLPPDSVREAS